MVKTIQRAERTMLKNIQLIPLICAICGSLLLSVDFVIFVAKPTALFRGFMCLGGSPLQNDYSKAIGHIMLQHLHAQ